jgi:hypothetical protein
VHNLEGAIIVNPMTLRGHATNSICVSWQSVSWPNPSQPVGSASPRDRLSHGGDDIYVHWGVSRLPLASNMFSKL